MNNKEQKALERDAARYRFLRTKESRDDKECTRRALRFAIVDWAKNLERGSLSPFWSNMDLDGDAMDRAIDKAMRASTQRPAAPAK